MTTMIINGTLYDKLLDYNDHIQVIEWQGRSLQSRSYEEVRDILFMITIEL